MTVFIVNLMCLSLAPVGPSTQARTGYPFIDAIMTQLREEGIVMVRSSLCHREAERFEFEFAPFATGWIHHLARHAVACFLTRCVQSVRGCTRLASPPPKKELERYRRLNDRAHPYAAIPIEGTCTSTGKRCVEWRDW